MWVDEVLPYPICWLGFRAMEILTFEKIEILKDEIKSQLWVNGGKLHRIPTLGEWGENSTEPHNLLSPLHPTIPHFLPLIHVDLKEFSSYFQHPLMLKLTRFSVPFPEYEKRNVLIFLLIPLYFKLKEKSE